MCDYSLEHLASRPAKVGDKLVSTKFPSSITRGFSAPDEPYVAVCLMPGTEIAFDTPPKQVQALGLLPHTTLPGTTAIFREINLQNPHDHHDALDFDGKIVLLTRLVEGQTATVLQLPVDRSKLADTKANAPVDSQIVVNEPATLDA